jgi:hypothetical protein
MQSSEVLVRHMYSNATQAAPHDGTTVTGGWIWLQGASGRDGTGTWTLQSNACGSSLSTQCTIQVFPTTAGSDMVVGSVAGIQSGRKIPSEARLADARVPSLLMWCSTDPGSDRLHREYTLHLPAVLGEDPAPEKYRVVDGSSSRLRATPRAIEDSSIVRPQERTESRQFAPRYHTDNTHFTNLYRIEKRYC